MPSGDASTRQEAEVGAVRLRAGTAADVPTLLALMEASLGPGPTRSARYWTWKHEQNPFGPSSVLVAEADGRVVGLRVFMHWEFQSGGDVVPAARAVDVAVDAAWRRQGIFTRLTRQLTESVRREGRALLFSTPNAKSAPGHIKMGWTMLDRPTRWIYPARPLRLLQSVLSSGGGTTEAASGEAAPEGYASIADLAVQAERSGFLSVPASRDTRLGTHRTAAYLHWRYGSIPGYTYRAVWDLDGKDGAAVIFRVSESQGRRALLLSELLVAPTAGGRRAGRVLVRRLIRDTGVDYATAIASWKTPEQRVLACSGFLPLPRRGPVVTVRPLAPAGPRPTRLAGWRFSLGDLEVL